VPWVRSVALANPAFVSPGHSGGSVAGRLEQATYLDYWIVTSLFDRYFVARTHRLHCDPRERRIHLLTHTLLFPADGPSSLNGSKR
jgi:hypothetical protein